VTAAVTAVTAGYPPDVVAVVAVLVVTRVTVVMAIDMVLAAVMRALAAAAAAALVHSNKAAAVLDCLVKAQAVRLAARVVLVGKTRKPLVLIPLVITAAAAVVATVVLVEVRVLFALFGQETSVHSHQQTHRIFKWNFIFVLQMVNPLITQSWATIFVKRFQTLIRQTCPQSLHRLNVFSQRHKSMKLLLV
jgi:hypothetical protein